MASTASAPTITVWNSADRPDRRPLWQQFTASAGIVGFHSDPRWLAAVCDGLRLVPYIIEATRGDRVVGLLPLAFVKSVLFGRFLVSLPYVNSAGVVAEDETAAAVLIDRAVQLADQLDVRYLELRHEARQEHPSLTQTLTSKVHMRLALPASADDLWKQFAPKVRNQVRKGEKCELTVHWGDAQLLGEFYTVFSHNMRDLGTPVFGRRLFRSILGQFDDNAELCVVRMDKQAVAAALLVHGPAITQVPSASSLRQYNSTNANMLMYWHLLKRAVERGQRNFDFGRSSAESNTFRFKKQWGAKPEPAVWQYHVRKGGVGEMRRENEKYDRLINIWRRLPVGLTRLLGPPIVRGIP